MMQHVGNQIEKYKNIILDGFDPVSSGGFTQVPNYILKSNDLSVGAKLTYAMLLSYAWQNDSWEPRTIRRFIALGGIRSTG